MPSTPAATQGMCTSPVDSRAQITNAAEAMRVVCAAVDGYRARFVHPRANIGDDNEAALAAFEAVTAAVAGYRACAARDSATETALTSQEDMLAEVARATAAVDGYPAFVAPDSVMETTLTSQEDMPAEVACVTSPVVGYGAFLKKDFDIVPSTINTGMKGNRKLLDSTDVKLNDEVEVAAIACKLCVFFATFCAVCVLLLSRE